MTSVYSAHVNHRDSTAQLPERKPPKWRWWSALAIALTVLTVTSALSPVLRHQWALSLTRQPTPYTVLAFKQASALPTTAIRGKEIKVSFIINNEEGHPVRYRYVLASGSNRKLTSLSTSDKTVSAGTAWVVTESVVPKCAKAACKIQISLPSQQEKIDFLVTLRHLHLRH